MQFHFQCERRRRSCQIGHWAKPALQPHVKVTAWSLLLSVARAVERAGLGFNVAAGLGRDVGINVHARDFNAISRSGENRFESFFGGVALRVQRLGKGCAAAL